MDLKYRLKEYIRYLRISISEFERSIDVSNSYVNNIGLSIGAKNFKKIIEKYPDLNKDWLLFGEGKMLYSELNTSTVNEPENKYVNESHTEMLIDLLKRENDYKAKTIERLRYELDECKKNSTTSHSHTKTITQEK
jgi:hypothetical protein